MSFLEGTIVIRGLEPGDFGMTCNKKSGPSGSPESWFGHQIQTRNTLIAGGKKVLICASSDWNL